MEEPVPQTIPSPANLVDFSSALRGLKDGLRVRRRAWKEGAFLFLEDHPIPRLQGELVKLRGTPIHCAICYFDPDDGITIGWAPRQDDMLLEDWSEVHP